MKKRLLCLILSAVLALGIAPATSLAETNGQPDYGKPGEDYAEGQAVVCIKGRAASAKSVKRNASFQMETLMEIKPEQGTGARTAALSSPEGSLVLVTSEKMDTETLIKTLGKDPNVEYAEPNYIMKPSTISEPTKVKGYKYQWGLNNQNNNGQTAANPAVDANFKEAWKKSTPSKNPVVAVIDSGVDYEHPALKGVMWDDGRDIPALEAMGGGRYGYNVRAGESSRDPMDTDIGHGTHCAGIIATQWDQAGVAGINSEQNQVEIMAIRFLGLEGGGLMSDALKAYAYIQTAVENGVNVVAVNNSWGPSVYDGSLPRSVSTAANAVGEECGVISCFAAGNDGVDLDKNTGSVQQGPYMIEVGAMDSTGTAAAFSQYGKETVDVFAPGTQILSTTTTDTGLLEMKKHDMPTQYLPQIMDEGDSWFYEDFENENASQVSLRLLDKDEKVVVSSAEALTPGCASGKGLQLPLDEIPVGETFSIEIGIPANSENLKNIQASDNVYLAFQAGFGNIMYDEIFRIKHYDVESKSWKTLMSTHEDSEGPFPAYLRASDHNWNQSTQEIDGASFITNPIDGEIKLCLQAETEMQACPDGEKPVFRLDNLGLGKKASDYFYSDGTSMAAPMVTGLAGLLASNGCEGAEIAARIRGGVNRKDDQGLENKSISDGFIDAAAALDKNQCVPVLNDLSVEGDTASLTGFFFGDTKGTLTIDGKEVSASTWKDREIAFQLPEGTRGKKEIRVVRSGGNAGTAYGKNYFSISPDTIGYKALSAPKLTYDEDGFFTSEDLTPVGMAAAGGKVGFIGLLGETSEFVMELYDVATDTWEKAKLPDDLVVNFGLPDCYKFTGGKEKLYLTYLDGNNEGKIGVYDTRSKKWKTTVTKDLEGAEAIAVYGDQLIAAGGAAEEGALKSVKVMDPDTGKTVGSLPDLPEARVGANLCASGNLLILYGGYADSAGMFAGDEEAERADTMVYDGTKWTVDEDNFFSDQFGGFDESQTLDYAVGATNSGLIAAGPVQNWGEENGRDTWAFDAKTNKWSAREDVLCSQYKTTSNVGVTHDGVFYVRARGDLEENPAVFRALTGIDHTGPTGDPAKDEQTPPAGEPGDNQTKPSGGQTDTANANQPSAVRYAANANALNKNIKVVWNKNNLKTTWGKVSGADGYEVYAAAHGNKYAKVKTIKGAKKTTYTIKKIKGKKLRPAGSYKVAVKAYRVVKGKKQYVGTSLTMHTVGKSNKTYTNPKRVKAAKKSVTLRAGKSKKISVKVTKQSSKKKLLKTSLVPKLRYFSTNPKVATVAAKGGTIKAKKKGACMIYAVGANGVKTKIKVKVR